jgi:hypothetical protein
MSDWVPEIEDDCCAPEETATAFAAEQPAASPSDAWQDTGAVGAAESVDTGWVPAEYVAEVPPIETFDDGVLQPTIGTAPPAVDIGAEYTTLTLGGGVEVPLNDADPNLTSLTIGGFDPATSVAPDGSETTSLTIGGGYDAAAELVAQQAAESAGNELAFYTIDPAAGIVTTPSVDAIYQEVADLELSIGHDPQHPDEDITPILAQKHFLPLAEQNARLDTAVPIEDLPPT